MAHAHIPRSRVYKISNGIPCWHEWTFT